MELKPGASLIGVSDHMFIAALVVEGVYQAYGFHECVITSGNDGKHSAESLHYKGRALDFRTWHIHPESLVKMAADIRAKLGLHYDVIIEHDHLHIEHDPHVLPQGATT
jgi:hypothetical protein